MYLARQPVRKVTASRSSAIKLAELLQLPKVRAALLIFSDSE